MGKFFGKIGFVSTEETAPDIWTTCVQENDYIGDVLNNVGLWRSSDGANDDVELDCEISVIADPYAFANYPYIRYIVHNGVKLKVKSVRPNYPRIVLKIGGIYNG